MNANQSVEATLKQIRAMGVSFALDDFGTGYSSLSYVHKFPIDKIKIDRSFIVGIPNDPGSVAIVRAVAALAESLGMRMMAEGIDRKKNRSRSCVCSAAMRGKVFCSRRRSRRKNSCTFSKTEKQSERNLANKGQPLRSRGDTSATLPDYGSFTMPISFKIFCARSRNVSSKFASISSGLGWPTGVFFDERLRGLQTAMKR